MATPSVITPANARGNVALLSSENYYWAQPEILRPQQLLQLLMLHPQEFGFSQALMLLNDRPSRGIQRVFERHPERAPMMPAIFPQAPVASPGAGANVTFTIASTQHQPVAGASGIAAGAYAPARVGTILWNPATGLEGKVTAITPTAGAWVVTVTPMMTTDDWAGAAGLTTGIGLPVVGTIFGEGTGGIGGMTPVWDWEQHYLQIMKEGQEFTGSEAAAAATWLDMGDGTSTWHSIVLDEARLRSEELYDRQCFVSNPNQNNLTVTEYKMTGIDYYIGARGLTQPYAAGSLTTSAFKGVINYLNSQMGGYNDFDGFAQQEFMFDLNDILAALDPNGLHKFDREGGDVRAVLDFTKFKYSSYNFAFMKERALDNPDGLGAGGSNNPYFGMAWGFPRGNFLKTRNGEKVPMFEPIHAEHNGVNRRLEFFRTGSVPAPSAGMASNEIDTGKNCFRMQRGLHPKGGNHAFRFQRT